MHDCDFLCVQGLDGGDGFGPEGPKGSKVELNLNLTSSNKNWMNSVFINNEKQ